LKSLKQMKKLNERIHFEIMRGSFDQNDAYCSKQGSLVEYGDKPRQGVAKAPSRTAEMFVDIIDHKMSKYDAMIKYKHIYAKSYKAISHCMGVQPDPPAYKPKDVTVVWGKTGVGKSRRAREYLTEMAKVKYFVKTPLSGKWWDGYRGEPGVIIEEFSSEQMSIEEFLILTDCYPTQVQVKGDSVTFAPEHIVVTAQHEPAKWYSFITEDKREALMRRINQVIHM